MNAFLLREPSRKCYTVSPILFSLYINDFMIRNFNYNLFKYADDMGLAGLLQKDYINDSGEYVGELLCFLISCTAQSQRMVRSKL